MNIFIIMYFYSSVMPEKSLLKLSYHSIHTAVSVDSQSHTDTHTHTRYSKTTCIVEIL